jgi:hypothetical protein
MKSAIIISLFLVDTLINSAVAQKNCTITPNKVVPTENQINYQQMEVVGFLNHLILPDSMPNNGLKPLKPEA